VPLPPRAPFALLTWDDSDATAGLLREGAAGLAAGAGLAATSSFAGEADFMVEEALAGTADGVAGVASFLIFTGFAALMEPGRGFLSEGAAGVAGAGVAGTSMLGRGVWTAILSRRTSLGASAAATDELALTRTVGFAMTETESLGVAELGPGGFPAVKLVFLDMLRVMVRFGSGRGAAYGLRGLVRRVRLKSTMSCLQSVSLGPTYISL
jgi:hypothetical protein